MVRGRHEPQVTMLAFIDLETRVPPDHPLRVIKKLADQALKALSPDLDRMYADVGLLVDSAHHGGYPWLGAPGDPSEQVGHEVGAAPLPAGSAEDCGDGASESLMSVRYHQLHPAEAPGGQRA